MENIKATGTREEVFSGQALRTSKGAGGLTKDDIFYNTKTKKYCSKKRSEWAKAKSNLPKA